VAQYVKMSLLVVAAFVAMSVPAMAQEATQEAGKALISFSAVLLVLVS
jgi:hypothetical protein